MTAPIFLRIDSHRAREKLELYLSILKIRYKFDWYWTWKHAGKFLRVPPRVARVAGEGCNPKWKNPIKSCTKIRVQLVGDDYYYRGERLGRCWS